MPLGIPIRIWMHILEFNEPNVIYSSEVWSPLTNQEFG